MSPSRSFDSKSGLGPPSSEHSPTFGPRRSARPTLSSTPTAFFVKSEEEVEQLTESNTLSGLQGSYGVKSLDSTTSNLGESHSREQGRECRSADKNTIETPAASTNQQQPPAGGSSRTSPSRHIPSQQQQYSTSRLPFSLTPLHVDSSGTESAPVSTPRSASLRSLRLSDDESVADDATSQAVTSGGEEEEDEQIAPQVGGASSEAAPQLVMPSLSLPTRKPFSANGRNMGRLKVLVAGRKGTGKSSLIKAMLQNSEDIVHVDATPSQDLVSSSQDKRSAAFGEYTFLETQASTRAYPFWWCELEDSRSLKRRKSAGEPVLERNVSFIEATTSDYQQESSHSAIITYLEHCLQRNFSLTSLSDNELLGILSGQGGVQVDVVLYMFTENPQPVELELLRELAKLTNIVPVCGKSDLLQTEEIQIIKNTLSNELASTSLPDLRSVQGETTAIDAQRVFTVSSAATADEDNMDASLLMSPDYVQPLFPSELPRLLSVIFDAERAAQFRHITARKSLQWRKKTLSENERAANKVNVPIPARDRVLPKSSTVSSAAYSSQAQATQASDFLPLFRIRNVEPGSTMHTKPSRWAVELQRALNNENNRLIRQSPLGDNASHTRLANWLSESGNIHSSPVSDAVDSSSSIAHDQDAAPHNISATAFMEKQHIDTVDPLGLIEWNERFRHRALLLAKVMGGCGILGAVTVWLLKTIGLFSSGAFGGDPSFSPAVWVEEKISGGLLLARY